LKEVPEALGNLMSLTSLNLNGCGGLKEIPEALGNLTSLTSLDLGTRTSSKRIPKAVGKTRVTTLEKLNLWETMEVKEDKLSMGKRLRRSWRKLMTWL
jgi:Leucine-rich repeat (LRR) protein